MTDIVVQFAQQFSIMADKDITIGDDQRSANNPVLFVFIGDRTADALKLIYREIQNKWSNSEGVLFFYINSGNNVDMDKVYQLPVNCGDIERKELRKAINDRFCNDDQLLSDLNRKSRMMQTSILEFGKIYQTYDRINLAVVTRADDPLNVLLPDITLFLKTRLKDDFRIITSDLYVLVNEKEGSEDFEYGAANSVAFFRELEYIQSESFVFSKPLEILQNTNKKLDIASRGLPLFDLAYILGDKCEHGFINPNVQEENYEIISYLNLLKNRKINTRYDSEHVEQYNDYQFKKSISPENGKHAYATAGLAKVKRPNQAIAVNVLYHFFIAVLSRMREQAQHDKNEMTKIFQIDDYSMNSRIGKIVCNSEKVNEMNSLISINLPFSQLRRLTLREAEDALYGDTCLKYFNENYVQPAYKLLEELDLHELITNIIMKDIVENPKLGLYCACEWLGRQGIQDIIFRMKKNIGIELNQMEENLRDISEEPVAAQSFSMLPILEKKNIRNFKKYLFDNIYGKKVEILKMQIKQKIIGIYESTVEEVYQKMTEEKGKLDECSNQIRLLALKSAEESDEYLGQNVQAYYKGITEGILKEMEADRGRGFYFEERFFGNIHNLLQNGVDMLLKKAIEICSREILTNARFSDSFETELLNRANNVVSSYENKNILTREDLFNKLYKTLEENAVVNCNIFKFAQKHRYEEKYFFGDFDSDFIKYAFDHDKGKRTFKLGCVHEKRTSGIEKLNLMGGFNISNMRFTENSMKYYNAYLNEGFQLHSIDSALLPDLNA